MKLGVEGGEEVGLVEGTKDFLAEEEDAFLAIATFMSVSDRRQGRQRQYHLSSGSSPAESFLCSFWLSFVKRRVKVFRIKLCDCAWY